MCLVFFPGMFLEMENSNSEMCGVEPNVEGSIDDPASTSSSYKLFSRQATGHQMAGGVQGT